MNEIEEWLNSRIGLNFRSGLGRMQQAVALLGNPERSYPTIHVTGTNGKGSTIAFMRQLFAGHGRKTGCFTSPHMISIHDRICINRLLQLTLSVWVSRCKRWSKNCSKAMTNCPILKF